MLTSIWILLVFGGDILSPHYEVSASRVPPCQSLIAARPRHAELVAPAESLCAELSQMIDAAKKDFKDQLGGVATKDAQTGVVFSRHSLIKPSDAVDCYVYPRVNQDFAGMTQCIFVVADDDTKLHPAYLALVAKIRLCLPDKAYRVRERSSSNATGHRESSTFYRISDDAAVLSVGVYPPTPYRDQYALTVTFDFPSNSGS
jgi:hypothetical protein